MKMPELGITSEDLVVGAQKLVSLQRALWFDSEEGKSFLSATDRNQLSFTWEALYKDRTVIRQYDDVTFLRALKDEQYIPSLERLVSTDTLDKRQVVQFVLFPIAYTRKHCLWYQNPYNLVIHPEKGERLIAKWLTDYRPRDGWLLRRHVIGIAMVDENESVISQAILVLSPSGSMFFTGTEDVSYDGE